jgi:hypothetical protein
MILCLRLWRGWRPHRILRPCCFGRRGYRCYCGFCGNCMKLAKVALWSRVLLEKLIVVHLVKLPTFYETWKFITVFTTAFHWSLSCARWFQSTPSNPTKLMRLCVTFYNMIDFYKGGVLAPAQSPDCRTTPCWLSVSTSFYGSVCMNTLNLDQIYYTSSTIFLN